MTLSEKQPLKTKKCCACNIEKSITSFYKNNSYPDCYDSKCKHCKKFKKSCARKARKKMETDKYGPKLWNVKKKDWIETYEFLLKIGYSLEKDIHEQFCEKHNLIPRKRGYEKTIKYSPQDLGMI
jgi:hypothetical protein